MTALRNLVGDLACHGNKRAFSRRPLAPEKNKIIARGISYSKEAYDSNQGMLEQASKAFSNLTDTIEEKQILDQAGGVLKNLTSGLEGGEPPVQHWGTQRALQAISKGFEPITEAANQGTAFVGDLIASVDASIGSALPSIPSELSGPAESASAAFASASSAVTTTQSALSDVVTQASASMTAATAVVAGASSGGEIQSHFGLLAFQRILQSISDKISSQMPPLQVPQLQAPDLGNLPDLSKTLSELQQSLTQLVDHSPALPMGMSIDSAYDAVDVIVQQQISMLTSSASDIFQSVSNGDNEQLMNQLQTSMVAMQANGIGGHNLLVLALTISSVMAAVSISSPSKGYDGYTTLLPYDDHIKLDHQYSAEDVAEYFRRRPLAVAHRAAQVAIEAAGFGVALLLDIWTGRLEKNEEPRAIQLRGIIERLGPAYIKVAQALSTRVDLLTPKYYEQIQMLQDRVPPFPCELAMTAMEGAFGRPTSAVFEKISDRPIAAASLGQVYRATLKAELGGYDVAVKVLRPGVLEQVGLDIFLIRKVATFINENGSMNTDWAAVVDEWALRFFAEMDYDTEARNAGMLKQDMKPLSGINIADIVGDLSTADVMTMVWVDGEKLSESRAGDIRELCSTLLNAYLIQLLETGFLHADPHPGNLIRTPDGKICILDYGLMTQVTEDQRWALLEYIAHLSTENWEALAQDLQVMGFIPPEVDPKQSGLIEPLGEIMKQLVGGGGAAKVNIDKVTNQLTELGKKYPFQIPPFFSLILRAFSVIEGIALKVDPDYAIVKECFPYLTRRLLQDDSDRAKAILKDLLYGNKKRLDIERLTRVASGFGSYTTDGLNDPIRSEITPLQVASSTSLQGASSTSLQAASGADTLSIDPILKDALITMLGRRGSYVQQLLVDEAVAAVDAMSRNTLYTILQALLASAPAMITTRGVAALGPLRGVVLPLPTFVEVLSRITPTLASTPEDREALAVVKGVALLLERMPQTQVTEGYLGRAASELAPLLPELRPGLTYVTEMFIRAFTKRIIERLGVQWRENIEPSLVATGFFPRINFRS